MVFVLAANAQVYRLSGLLHRNRVILVAFFPILIYFTSDYITSLSSPFINIIES